nr:DUF6456 domain-containing protein [Pseudoroseicyclus aestuarii]
MPYSGETADPLPAWVPEAARHYLAHVEAGRSIRALARGADVHASTILRQVRRLEGRRDDPLVDGALRQLSLCLPRARPPSKERAMKIDRSCPAEGDLAREGLRVLRRLAEPRAVLAVAREMETGLVLRDEEGAAPQRLATVSRSIAEAMALKDWIAAEDPAARILRYRITGPGRAALRALAEAPAGADGFAEAQRPFGAEAREDEAAEADGRLRHMRSALGESPLAGLARRRDKDGKPFLSRDLVAAGERLREDFELAQIGPRVTQDWDRFLSGSPATGRGGKTPSGLGARDRVAAALSDLGPGLGDVALRCCCYLEGMESLEKRMGWSARSGKIVLRIALQRLRRHYDESPHGQMIG